MNSSYKRLQLALAVFGAVFLLVYPVASVWRSGWAWSDGPLYHSQYFMMIVGIYATLGIFLIRASRQPEANVSLIWFVVWSSVVHAAIMAVQSFGHGGPMDHMDHRGHLYGDVPALLLVAVVLGALTKSAALGRRA